MKGWFLVLINLSLLIGCSDFNSDAVRNFTFEAPRPFGYVLGDTVTQHIRFDTDDSLSLQESSLPKTGAINRWLNLNEISVKKHAINSGMHYDISLHYQIFYAALEVKLLTIPGFTLNLTQHGTSINQSVPAWAFNISPLRELSVRKSADGEYKRPDAPAEALETGLAKLGFWLSLSMTLMLGLYLAARYGLLPQFFKPSIFKPAVKQLSLLSKDNIEQALTLVHQAFNQLNQQPLFAQHLGHFYQAHPEYQQLATELDWFFSYSNRFFFTQERIPVALDLDKLQALCQTALNIERGRR